MFKLLFFQIIKLGLSTDSGYRLSCGWFVINLIFGAFTKNLMKNL